MANDTIKTLLLAAVMATACVAPVFADPLPEAMQNGGINYVSGGIGEEERNALKDVRQGYNLHISNADQQGAFTLDNNLVIRSKGGREVISASDAGPLFYAKLPPGQYTISATNGSESKERQIRITGDKSENIHFTW